MKEWEEMKKQSLFIEVGTFDTFGGWELDTQLIPNIGSSYLLAHGLGEPVKDAKKKVIFPETGEYHAYVFTRDWVAPWKKGMAPGLFELLVKDSSCGVFGNEEEEWHWQKGASFEIKELEVEITLHDLTGFEGRCAGVFFTKDSTFIPPKEISALDEFRRYFCNNQENKFAGSFDLVVAGGGLAGICTAITAARKGVTVAFINDRFVVGGNNSSEVTVLPGGECNFEPYPNIGNLVMQFDHERIPCERERDLQKVYKDNEKLEALKREKNITVFLGYFLVDAKTEGSCIKRVSIMNVKDRSYLELEASFYADCTGDSTLGAASGADYETTTNGHMGMTNLWFTTECDTKQTFPSCPWAIDLHDVEFPGRHGIVGKYQAKGLGALSNWYWESGCEHDPIERVEYMRDTNFRAMFGAWDTIKNVDGEYPNHKLKFCCYTNGKRESRRLFGDVILTKSEAKNGIQYEDGCVPSTWDFDVHYPDPKYYQAFREGDSFITYDYHEKFQKPYFIPYRCLYSRNIENLFMAGRNVSVSHDALGTVRVMKTGGMMGEVIGRAVAICKKHQVLPRTIYTDYLEELKQALREDL